MSNDFSQNTNLKDFNIDYLRITANNVASSVSRFDAANT